MEVFLHENFACDGQRDLWLGWSGQISLLKLDPHKILFPFKVKRLTLHGNRILLRSLLRS